MWYDQQAAALTQQHKTEEQKALWALMDRKLRHKFGISMDRLYDPTPHTETDDGCSHFVDRQTGQKYSYDRFNQEWHREDSQSELDHYNIIAKFGQVVSSHPSAFCCRCYRTGTDMKMSRVFKGEYLCGVCIMFMSLIDNGDEEELSFMMQDMFD